MVIKLDENLNALGFQQATDESNNPIFHTDITIVGKTHLNHISKYAIITAYVVFRLYRCSNFLRDGERTTIDREVEYSSSIMFKYSNSVTLEVNMEIISNFQPAVSISVKQYTVHPLERSFLSGVSFLL